MKTSYNTQLTENLQITKNSKFTVGTAHSFLPARWQFLWHCSMFEKPKMNMTLKINIRTWNVSNVIYRFWRVTAPVGQFDADHKRQRTDRRRMAVAPRTSLQFPPPDGIKINFKNQYHRKAIHGTSLKEVLFLLNVVTVQN